MSDEREPDAPSNVVTVAFGNETKKPERDRRYCRHVQYEVDEETRTVRCCACEAMLDPFAVLLQYASKERHFHDWERAQREEQKKIAELKEEEKRVKARTRGASRKDAAAAVAEERGREQLRKRAIAELARDVKKAMERIERLTAGGRVSEPWTT